MAESIAPERDLLERLSPCGLVPLLLVLSVDWRFSPDVVRAKSLFGVFLLSFFSLHDSVYDFGLERSIASVMTDEKGPIQVCSCQSLFYSIDIEAV